MSVAICTRGRADDVTRLLDALDHQTRLPDEVLVVDGAADDTLEEVIDTSGRVRYVHLPDDDGLTEARNEAIRQTSGDLCVFLDDDTIPEPQLVRELADVFSDRPDLGGAGGVPLEPVPPSVLRAPLLRLFLRGPFAHPVSHYQDKPHVAPFRVHRLAGSIQSYRREVLEELRFDENLCGYCAGEDKDFSYRVAERHPVLLVPSARAYHDVTGWGSQELREKFEVKVLSYSYHFFKNLDDTVTAKIHYAWLLIGVLCEGLLYTMMRLNVDPLRGIADGFRSLLGDMSGGGGFIVEDPRSEGTVTGHTDL